MKDRIAFSVLVGSLIIASVLFGILLTLISISKSLVGMLNACV